MYKMAPAPLPERSSEYASSPSTKSFVVGADEPVERLI